MNQDRYGSNSKGVSPALSAILNEWKKMPRSTFPLGNRKIFALDPFAIVPFRVGVLFPNTDTELSFDVSIESINPMVTKIKSGIDCEIRVYKINNSDCWEGWNNFVTQGRTGKVVKTIPAVDFSLGTFNETVNQFDANYHTLLPFNPSSYLKLVPTVFMYYDALSFGKNSGAQWEANCTYTDMTGNSVRPNNPALNTSALPFVFYAKIAREYLNANLMQGNPNWFPENENHELILPYDCPDKVTCANYDEPNAALDPLDTDVQPHVVDEDDPTYGLNQPWLNVLYYAQRQGDYFNTGSPFPDLLRGDVPTMSLGNIRSVFDKFDTSIDNLTMSRLLWQGVPSGNTPVQAMVDGHGQVVAPLMALNSETASYDELDTLGVIHGSTGNFLFPQTNDLTQKYIQDFRNNITEIIEHSQFLGNAIQMSLNQFRQLVVLTSMRERLARTDGSYNEMIKAFFGHNPNWHDHKPQYCGGHYQRIFFDEITQNSESNSTPLGTLASRAISSAQSRTIHIHSDDYGMYMAVMVLTPDEYRTQGVDRRFFALTNAEQYLPVKNNLPPQAVKNKELYVSGDPSVDEDVFNYQELFAEFKSRPNEIAGMLDLPIDKVGDLGAHAMHDLFVDTPQFNQSFVQGKLDDNEELVFASMEQPKFIATVATREQYTGPLPYVQQQTDFGLSY